ncbi:MAG: glycoside hydrolase N-terminal domain-containing protein [Bacteroidales bacterium]
MKRIKKILVSVLIMFSGFQYLINSQEWDLEKYDLKFAQLSKSWDEALPLGNGMLGTLIWENKGKLRFSFDRADLWDLRPTANLDRPEWKFSWVKEQWQKNKYSKVQELFDIPYDRDPGPSKIPAGAIEFDISKFGTIDNIELHLNNALCKVIWNNGTTLETFVNASKTNGWFRFSGLENAISPEFIAPVYSSNKANDGGNSLTGQDLKRLGYAIGEINKTENTISFTQNGWGGFSYQVFVKWKTTARDLEGCWSISSEFPDWEKQVSAREIVEESMNEGFELQFSKHAESWKNFWQKSAVSIPDFILNRQWYLEMYKLKAASGNGAPPISLQAVWTADNGKLPPWKGDFHNDLNTQLSYWPAYSSNHIEEETGFIDWLEKCKPEFESYTKSYFGTSGLNVPGVVTLTGKPMGGWIQYSFSPTIGAWLAQHYYLHWRYTMDREFLSEKAYPWISGVARHLYELSEMDKNGKRKLPLSSSPEIFDNSRQAWFSSMTNYDLALVRFTFEKAAELANELGKTDEAAKWKDILAQWPYFDIDAGTGFTFAKGVPYTESHRHFSHLMAFHPLGLVDWSKGEKDQKIILNTLANLDRIGAYAWCGYSYSWLANLKARAMDGKGAAEALKIFATCFCLPNSFHVNGDQSGTGKSKFTYRPFTLEGNFAFAAGLQEMLIQSHTGTIVVFPAIPDEWKNTEFKNLRTEGAFLVSARMDNGKVVEVEVISEKGGELKLKNPFKNEAFNCTSKYMLENNIVKIQTSQNQKIKLVGLE